MRLLVLNKLRPLFDDDCLYNLEGDEVKDFAKEIEVLSDQDLLDLFESNVQFQG